jgi:hypothetical protein
MKAIGPVSGAPQENAEAQLEALRAKLTAVITSFKKGLASPAFRTHLKSNRYLDKGTPERAYWHAGYTAAMCATLQFIQEGTTEYPVTDTE